MEQILKDFATAISPALQQLVIALVVALLTACTAWVKSKYEFEKSKLSAEKRYLLEMAVTTGVRSAKQIYGEAKEKNKEKLKHAFEVTDAIMRSYGFVIDSAVIVAVIETAVFDSKQVIDHRFIEE